MEITYSPRANDELLHWKKTNNTIILKKIRALIESISETPIEGIGKPEALKYDLSGHWSRRITKEHRLVYQVFDDIILVLSLKGHYEP
ncbi:Txe/YoeB family addiction module toxin [Dyadobacter sp. LJ53]|uniref:Txe/YoeB family addiction module toxin n=1 Tax=Dyadobacter chenwenxiniae TaxID=2906456 RepID=UPI001F3655BA|nr:Txe/YoeB family addiction module toxin [Dyadobacter chenwenxiniae]MCF0049957.1 Txe/YoeB family addiction module toxin [Dyadobacter chenwenxiniae]